MGGGGRKKVCVIVREHRQPDGGAIKTSSIPSLSCRRGTEDPHAPVVTPPPPTTHGSTPPLSPFKTPPTFCVRLALATPQEFFPHPRRERERGKEELVGWDGGVEVGVGSGGWGGVAAGQLLGGDETRLIGEGTAQGVGGCVPPKPSTVFRAPLLSGGLCPESPVLNHWPLGAGAPL